MSDPTRRRRYRYDRVVIEKARILDAQFDDAVLFFTGAQIELMRNMTEYLRRLDTYCSDYHLGYYLTPTVEDYDSLMAIVAELEETLMGNPNTIWGYKERWHEYMGARSTGAGTTSVYSTAVPAGYVYVLEQLEAIQNGGVPLEIEVWVRGEIYSMLIDQAPAQPSDIYIILPTNITLMEGDYIEFVVTALPNLMYAYLGVWGHMMVVP